MRVGIFTDTYYPEINGVATSVYQLKKELEARGNEVYVFTVSNPMQKETEEHVYRIKSIPFFLLKDRRMSCSFSKKWYTLIETLNLDIIHTQTEFTIGHLGRKAAQKFHIPLIHTYHTMYEDYTHYFKIPGNQKLKGIIRNLSRICLNRADLVVVPTQKVETAIRAYGVKKDIIIQPTGISLSKFEKIDQDKIKQLKITYGIYPQDHILLSIGRLSEEKNIEEILSFLEKLIYMDSKVKLLIVGDGPERSKLQQLAVKLKINDHVIFTGEVPWNEIQNYYALGQVFVSGSTSETQGLTYAEALASGKPLLVRKDDCLKTILLQGINGYAYESQVEFIKYYKKIYLDKTIAIDEAKIKDSIKNLSVHSFGKNMEQIYQKVINNQKQIEGYDYEKICSEAS